ncbi:MAG: hypothetical protein HZA16_14935 [Nitrospirae bacterium]|nr:hypothetical protein [Nitrospirota bacterium]
MKKFLLPLLLIISVISGCGKEKVKPSADSLLTAEAVNRIEVIRSAYQGKDSPALKNMTEEKLADEIFRGLNFEKAELLFTPKFVRITGEFIFVSLNWRGVWQTVKSRSLENRGTADLVLQRENLKLTRIEGDNPFVVPAEK